MCQSKINLENLISSDYEHSFDRKALDALQGTPGLEFLMKKFMRMSIDKLMQIQYLGSNLKVTSVSASKFCTG